MKALAIVSENIADERLGTIGLDQMKRTATESTPHHPSAELSGVG